MNQMVATFLTVYTKTHLAAPRPLRHTWLTVSLFVSIFSV